MKRLCVLLGIFTLVFAACLYAGGDDFSREKAIIAGLSKKQLKDRVKYLEMAMYSDSPAVFEKLAQMYKVSNRIQDEVFRAMEWQNRNNGGIFSEQFAQAMLEEFERLKKAKLEGKIGGCPQTDYLDLCIATCQEKPFPGYDKFIAHVMENLDEMLEGGWDYTYDPIKLKDGFRAHCILYFAMREKPSYMKKLAEVTSRGDILEIILVLKLFMEKKDGGIFDYVTQKLIDQEKRHTINVVLLKYYLEYALILNKKVPQMLVEAKKREDEERRKRVEKMFRED